MPRTPGVPNRVSVETLAETILKELVVNGLAIPRTEDGAPMDVARMPREGARRILEALALDASAVESWEPPE